MLSGMSDLSAKDVLHHYLRLARAAMLAKLDGLGEYDARRPMTPSGTNLLGLVKHLASVELDYFGDVFGREHGTDRPWLDEDADPNDAFWARPEESSQEIVRRYAAACAFADATIADLDLDAPGRVPWWGERGEVTLHTMLVHVLAETNRHAGHADIVRESIDGAVGLNGAGDNLPDQDQQWWSAYRDTLERAAREASAERSDTEVSG